MRSAAAAVLLAGTLAIPLGCTRPAPQSPRPAVSGCVDLPGAHRYSLRLGPDGHSLYWIEWASFHGYAESWPRSYLARWSLDAPAAEVVTERIDNLFRLLGDGRIVGLHDDDGLVVWDRGAAELVSLPGDLDQVELIDDRTAVYALAGAVWVQPLHREAARWLATADELLGVDGAAVIVRRGARLVRIDVATGTETERPAPPGELLKATGGAVITSTETGVGVQRGTGDADEVLVGTDWNTRPGPDGVRAWRAAGDRLEVALVSAAGADRLPAVTGPVAVESAVRLPDGRVAYLVVHDTDRDGAASGEDEVELCLIARGATTLAVPARTVPRHLASAAAGLDRAAAALGATGWSALGRLGLPRIRFTGVPGRADQQARWADTRTAAAAVIAAVGDPALRVELDYVDGRRAASTWSPHSGRRTAMAGLGGVLAPDPADYDVVLGALTLDRIPGNQVRCAGTVTNQTDRALDGLVLDCVDSDEDEVIPLVPAGLAPGATGRFDGTTTATGDDRLVVSVHEGPGRRVRAHVHRDFPRYRQRLVDVAVAIFDRTRLRFADWTSDDGTLIVTLEAPDDFDTWSETAREVAAEAASKAVRAADRSLFDDAPDTGPVRLTITTAERRWRHDGTRLTLDADP